MYREDEFLMHAVDVFGHLMYDKIDEAVVRHARLRADPAVIVQY